MSEIDLQFIIITYMQHRTVQEEMIPADTQTDQYTDSHTGVTKGIDKVDKPEGDMCLN